MARVVNGQLYIGADFLEANDGLGVGDGTVYQRHAIGQIPIQISSGTSDGQADRVFTTSGTASTSPTDIDVSGALTTQVGTFIIVELVGLVVRNTGLVDLRLGADAASVPIFGAAADFILIKPGGSIAIYAPAGYTVTASTGDIIQLDTASGTTTYQILLLGRSA